MKWQYLEKYKSLKKSQDKLENYNMAMNLLKIGLLIVRLLLETKNLKPKWLSR